MDTALLQQVEQIFMLAELGVDYSPRHGAACPCCGKRTLIYKSIPWDGDTKLRYHRCQNKSCILSRVNKSIKSVQQICNR